MHLKYQQQIIKPNYTSTFFFISSETPATKTSETHHLYLRKHPWYKIHWRLEENTQGSWVLTLLLCSFRSSALGHREGERSSRSDFWVSFCIFWAGTMLLFAVTQHPSLLLFSYNACERKINLREKTIKESIEQLLWRELLPAQHKKWWSSPS